MNRKWPITGVERIAHANALYADEPWAKLAVEAGFQPYDTESSARSAFAERMAELEAKIAELEGR